MMQNKVERLENDIIFVKKIGDQTAKSMIDLYVMIADISEQLRKEGKPVLILSDASDEGESDLKSREAAAKIGKSLDFDRSATFGAHLVLETTRDLMIQATQLNLKVRNFKTRDEAEKWLLSAL